MLILPKKANSKKKAALDKVEVEPATVLASSIEDVVHLYNQNSTLDVPLFNTDEFIERTVADSSSLNTIRR